VQVAEAQQQETNRTVPDPGAAVVVLSRAGGNADPGGQVLQVSMRHGRKRSGRQARSRWKGEAGKQAEEAGMAEAAGQEAPRHASAVATQARRACYNPRCSICSGRQKRSGRTGGRRQARSRPIPEEQAQTQRMKPRPRNRHPERQEPRPSQEAPAEVAGRPSPEAAGGAVRGSREAGRQQ